MFGLGAGEIFIILVFALIFIGPKKLPELARNLGKGIREFQRAKDDLMSHVNEMEGDHHPSLTGVNEAEESTAVEKEVTAMKSALEKNQENGETKPSSDEGHNEGSEKSS